MVDKRLKTVGIEEAVWRKLKLLAVQRGCTLSEAVDHLIMRSKEHGKENPEADHLGENTGNRPDGVDR